MVMRTQWTGRIALGLCLVGIMLAFATPAAAADESKPCMAEPTDQPIAFGDVLSGSTCRIDPVGDADIYRINASLGDVIRITAVDISGSPFLGVCIELLDPSNTRVGSVSCIDVSLQFSPPALPATGVYTLIVSEWGNDGATPYNLSLERLNPQRSEWPAINSGTPVADEIRPTSDLDPFRFSAIASDLLRFTATDTSGSPFLGLCLELFAPDGSALAPRTCGDVSVQLDVTLSVTGIYTAIVTEWGLDGATPYTLNMTCLSGSCQKLPVCDTTLQSDGALTGAFTLRTLQPVTWGVRFFFMNRSLQLQSSPLPVTDPATTIPIAVPAFPRLGVIGVLNYFSTDQGITCSDWTTVDTGTPPANAWVPSDEELRVMFLRNR